MSLTNDDKEWIEERLKILENLLVETMRGMQTELLRGLEAFSAGQKTAEKEKQ
jgi:hypothetical protein